MEPDLNKFRNNAQTAVQELLAVANLKPAQIVVVGCSSSEISGKKIGSASSIEIAEAVLAGILPILQEQEVFLAAQCCEHLNRSLVVEAACAEKYGLEEVTVVPHLKAGGGFATTYYHQCSQPVMVERVAAHAGIDIGDTFIGMHLRRVVVPVRGSIDSIGKAHLTMARTRRALIGGERAKYEFGKYFEIPYLP